MAGVGRRLLLRKRRSVGELSTGVRFHMHPLPAAAPKTVVLLRPLKCHCNKKGLSRTPRLYSNRGFPPESPKQEEQGGTLLWCPGGHSVPPCSACHLALFLSGRTTSRPFLLHWVPHDPQISHPPQPLLSSTQLAGVRSKAKLPSGRSLWGCGPEWESRPVCAVLCGECPQTTFHCWPSP